MSDIENTIKGMAALILTSGKLSEFHEKNLKAFPFIFFNDVIEAKIDYDLSVRHDADVDKNNNVELKKPIQSCIISYYLTLDEPKNNEIQKRYEALDQAVKNLLWKEIPVEIYINDKIVFKSKK